MDRIGHYLVRRKIGEGGMGAVYEAEEALARRRVALKVLRGGVAQERLISEVRLLARLDHPNIVRSLSSFEDAGRVVMVLEHVDGETLREVLEARGRLPWRDAAGIAAQMSRALSAAHASGVVHRDIKPENIMITRNGIVKVMDFGIAKIVGQAHTQTGTPVYMSPEHIDERALDPRSDVYSLGVVLYELLSGRPPFQSASPIDVVKMHLEAPPPALATVSMPDALETLLFTMLSKRPDDRPSADECAMRLAALLDGAVDRAPPDDGGRTIVTGPPASLEKGVRVLQPGSATAQKAAGSLRRPSHDRSKDTFALIDGAAARSRHRTVQSLLFLGVGVVLAGIIFVVVHDRGSGTPSQPSASAKVAPGNRAPGDTGPSRGGDEDLADRALARMVRTLEGDQTAVAALFPRIRAWAKDRDPGSARHREEAEAIQVAIDGTPLGFYVSFDSEGTPLFKTAYPTSAPPPEFVAGPDDLRPFLDAGDAPVQKFASILKPIAPLGRDVEWIVGQRVNDPGDPPMALLVGWSISAYLPRLQASARAEATADPKRRGAIALLFVDGEPFAAEARPAVVTAARDGKHQFLDMNGADLKTILKVDGRERLVVARKLAETLVLAVLVDG